MTGGLGGIGKLVGSWCVQSSHGSSVGLLGRTGKYTTCAPELTGGMLSVSMARCDVSITEEAQWWSTQSALGVDGHRMGSLVHAAGVLLDTVIGNQSAFLMRR